MSRTEELIALAREGDQEASETLITENAGLIWSIARRYMGRGTELDDLYQIGCVGFLKAVDDSNGTNFVEKAEKGFPEQQLVGKGVGILLGYEEYVNYRGEIRERSRVAATRSVDAIRSGDYKVPELKKIVPAADVPATAPEGFTADDELPF